MAQVSDVYMGAVAQRPIVTIDMPVFRNGAPLYIIGIPIDPKGFSKLLSDQKYPPDWYAGVLDRKGDIIARLRDPDGRSIGTPASATWRRSIEKSSEDIVENISLEGQALVNAYTTTRNGWIVGVGISKAALDAPVWRLQLLFAGIGAICVGLSLSFAWIIGRRFNNGTRLLQNAAMTMSNGKNVEPQTTGVHEYDELIAAFSKTSLLLLDRAKEKQRADAAEAALSERKKIFSQMHDSLGASLVDLIFHLRHATDWEGAQQKARQTLTELRLLVDSSLPESETIESVLADKPW
jgi:hypothetical protein